MNDTTAVEEAKTPAFCKKSWDANGVGTFVFGNGTTVSLDVNELSEDQKFNLMMHGLMQKGGDSYASAKGDFALGIASVQKVCDQLLNDQGVAEVAVGVGAGAEVGAGAGAGVGAGAFSAQALKGKTSANVRIALKMASFFLK